MKIPFYDDDDSLVVQANKDDDFSPWNINRPIHWVENFEFNEKLQIIDFYFGRSSSNFTLIDTKQRKYNITLEDFKDAIIKFGVQPGGFIDGTWTFNRGGNHYKIKGVI